MEVRVTEENKTTKQQRYEAVRRRNKAYLTLKCCFDFLSSLFASVILLIPMAIIALLIVMKDPGSPFYMQKRVGQNGAEIGVLKFRSMKRNADKLEAMLTPEQIARYKKEYKLADDPRLIGYHRAGDGAHCFGAILRRTSLDELPQIFWNICIKRNMSVIGPRPILHEELQEHYTSEEQAILLSMKPGLTGYWQAFARNNAGYKDHRRQDMELYYVSKASVLLDIRILWQTVFTVLRKVGAE